MVNLTTWFWVIVNRSTNRSRPPLLNGYLFSIASGQILPEMLIEFVRKGQHKLGKIWRLFFYLFSFG